MMRGLFKIGGITLVVCFASWSCSDAQAAARRWMNYCQPTYVAPTTTYSATESTGGRRRYRSAYQAPAASVQTRYYQNPQVTVRTGGRRRY